jgi:hypothetical protein
MVKLTPAVTVAGAGVDCLVSSRFSGPHAHAAARSFLQRLPLAGATVREGGQVLAGFAFEQVARRQAAVCEAKRRQRESGLIICA